MTTFPTLTTQRLSLRQLSNSDAQKIFALRSDPAINKYLDRAPCNSLEDALKFIDAIVQNSIEKIVTFIIKQTVCECSTTTNTK